MTRPPLFPGEPRTALLALKPAGFSGPYPNTADALSDPAIDDVASSMYGLLPTGGAWRSPDGAAFEQNSRLGAFLRALSGDFVTLYRRIYTIGLDSTASTLVDSLDDWESEYGLPDPCLAGEQTRAQRLRALLLKIRSTGTITLADFVNLAASAGYTISIDEPSSFTCGVSDCGGSDEMGGHIEYFWIVNVEGVAVDYFECGISECGVDPLSDFDEATALECLFRRLAPAWTRPIFNYS
ncbi:Uncharacterized protein YmfQ in lambdoid prophage, DUF2313 family [Mesorhizobium albiziae]|uniref:Uncharacterized protein YmfQ in lambdoid prophage, DUF2313 family n=1 Tax=Neomesorhizobium albiziae TaxID=335020 RepID=A0A1I3YDE2_9HYPH|nr:putative phage tail protein [Mesorhizobium albiziae]GLS29966.1 hypothetical protein GCM10007937_16740 [Mesorhizobium albiziae]SFK29196.1 Uncharacterized protein YmfQ in lambdoid prophage, DUF2313 family [Mesorhizobium albiziae]